MFVANIKEDFGTHKVRFSTNGHTEETTPTLLDQVAGYSSAGVTMTMDDVECWSPENPKLYDLTVSLIDDNGEVVDQKTVKYGIRTVEVTANGGFMLNGETRKIKGVCLHHDLGMIGTAVNKAALIRQVELLKSMGCDAIRTSHNTPSQMQMEVYDSLGMMVMAESFDMWQWPKCKNGYSRFYKDWWRRDLQNLVLANRLHPSIVMWSIGNEISEQGSKEGNRMAREMQNFIHSLDNTRPVTSGMDRIDDAISSGFAQVLDIPGINYRTHRYEAAHEKLRHGFVLGSETASTISSRGVYKFPVKRFDGKAYDDGQCSSYDMEACWWSNVPEEDWLLQEDKDWVIGEFVWTGFDYLGEPTPYDEYWPSRSSYFGIFDLAGLPKDRYYLYRSHWNPDEKTIHLVPHWTFPGREGEVTPVYCYTNYPTAELFVNGKLQGRISKNTEVKKGAGKDGRISDVNDPAIDRYRLRWNNVKYEPGELKVVVYDENGKEVGTQTVKTAGAAAQIQLTGDLGAAASMSFTDRNLFRGSEQLTVKLRGAYESISNLPGYSGDTYIEYGLETNLDFPEFLAPFMSQELQRRSQATSRFSLKINAQRRPEFQKTIFSTGWSYMWGDAWQKSHQLDVVDLNYLVVPWISDHFRSEYLNQITSARSILKYNYEDLLITKLGYTFYYSSSRINAVDPFRFSVRVGVETSGNMLSLLSEPLGFEKNDNNQYKVFGVAFAQYAKHDFSFTANWRLDRTNNLVAHLEWGVAVPYGNSTSLPFEKRYFSGGANSVRGWSVRELGPGTYHGDDKVIDYIKQSGDIKLGASVEYRSKLFWKVNGAAFVDAGNIWTIRDYVEQPGGVFGFDTFYKQIAVSYGLGLRFDFGVLVLRLDGGMKAYNPSGTTFYKRLPLVHPSMNRDFAFHLAVGYPF